ncbi:MAG: ROK family protein [Bradymonadia bacterium]|jgi:glucokinase
MRLGLDLGASKLAAARISAGGRAVDTRRWPTGRGTTPTALSALLREVRAWAGAVRSVGLGFPGLVDARAGVARSSVMLDGWVDVPLRGLVENAFEAPAAVDNDVNAAALGELRARAEDGESTSSLLFVSLGTGVGGAIVADGRLVRGTYGMAGEIGHLDTGLEARPCGCGLSGCVGALASGEAFAAGARQRALACEAVSRGLAAAVTLLDPGLVVLGGGVVDHRPEVVAHLAALTGARLMPAFAAATRFERARAGAWSGAYGAAALVQEAA